MRVRAISLGFYGDMRRYPGDVFVLKDPKFFSKRWMEKVEDKPASEPKRAERVVEDKKPTGDAKVI